MAKESREFKVKLNSLRMSPRKVGLVADLVRGKSLAEARQQLTHCSRRAARPLGKLLEAAVAASRQNGDVSEDTLAVAQLTVGPGRTLKRRRFAAQGRVRRILKRSANITLVLRGTPGSSVEAAPNSEGKKLRRRVGRCASEAKGEVKVGAKVKPEVS